MTRAIDIALLLIIIQASIGFVNATGIFPHNYYATPSNEASNYVVKNLTDFQVNQTTSPGIVGKILGIVSDLDLFAYWAWEAFWVFVRIVFTVVIVYPTLTDTFHLPAIVSAVLQIIIYYYYALFYGQLKSGKGLVFYE